MLDGLYSILILLVSYEKSLPVQEYFYGLSNDLSPHSYVANFNDLRVYRIGGGPQAPRSALPIGADPVANPLRLVPVTSDQMQELIHLVLALSYAEEPDQIISRYSLSISNHV